MQRLRRSIAIGCGLMALAASFAPAAQTFPTKPIRISQEVGKIIRTPELTERMLSLGAEPSPNTPEEFTRFVKAEMEKWGALAKQIGLKAE